MKLISNNELNLKYKKPRRKKNLFYSGLNHGVAIFLSAIILIPIILIVINSFKTSTEADLMNMSFPASIQWSNYITVIERGNLGRAFLNSLFISICSVTITVIVSGLAAFVLSRNRTKRNKAIYYFFLLGLIAPLNMIPAIKMLQKLQLMNTYLGIILLYASLLIPFSIFLYYGFIQSIPRDLDEAAIIDGCTGFYMFFKIILPLLKPVTFTVIILNFMNAWNDFVIPLYILNDSSKWPMTLSVYNFFGKFQSDWNLVCADIVLTILPIVIVYIFGQKYIISGMVSGSVKG